MPSTNDPCPDKVHQSVGDELISTSELKNAVVANEFVKKSTTLPQYLVLKRRLSDATQFSNSSRIIQTDSREFTYIDD